MYRKLFYFSVLFLLFSCFFTSLFLLPVDAKQMHNDSDNGEISVYASYNYNQNVDSGYNSSCNYSFVFNGGGNGRICAYKYDSPNLGGSYYSILTNSSSLLPASVTLYSLVTGSSTSTSRSWSAYKTFLVPQEIGDYLIGSVQCHGSLSCDGMLLFDNRISAEAYISTGDYDTSNVENIDSDDSINLDQSKFRVPANLKSNIHGLADIYSSAGTITEPLLPKLHLEFDNDNDFNRVSGQSELFWELQFSGEYFNQRLYNIASSPTGQLATSTSLANTYKDDSFKKVDWTTINTYSVDSKHIDFDLSLLAEKHGLLGNGSLASNGYVSGLSSALGGLNLNSSNGNVNYLEKLEKFRIRFYWLQNNNGKTDKICSDWVVFGVNFVNGKIYNNIPLKDDTYTENSDGDQTESEYDKLSSSSDSSVSMSLFDQIKNFFSNLTKLPKEFTTALNDLGTNGMFAAVAQFFSSMPVVVWSLIVLGLSICIFLRIVGR